MWVCLLSAVGVNLWRPVKRQHFVLIVERKQIPVLDGVDTIRAILDGLVFHDPETLPGR